MQVHWSAAEGNFVYSLGYLSLFKGLMARVCMIDRVVGRVKQGYGKVPLGVCSDGNTESHQRQSTEETVQNTPPHASKNS